MLAQQALESATAWHPLVVAIALLGELLAVVFVYRVLVRGGSPASTVLWMAVIIAAPWLGLLLYYLLPRRLQLRRLRRLRVRGSRLREVRGRAALPCGDGEPRAGLASLLAGADGQGLVGGNELTWLPAARSFVAEAIAAIDAARLHVHCVVYILRGDDAGQRFLAALARASQRGVVVRLLFDSLGSWGITSAHLAPLRAAGGRAEAFLPLLWKRRPFTVNLRNHRKLLVVDGEIGFVGGRNVGDEYFTDRIGNRRAWLDAMLAVRGPAVARMQDVFVEDWCTATDEVLADATQVQAPVGDSKVGIVCAGPDRDESDLWFAVVQAIGEAGATIDLSTPYLVLTGTLLFALQLAAARGVRVRIFTNGAGSEARVLYHAQRSHYAGLLAAGIEIHESVHEYNHAKLVVVDGRTVIVGSANFDRRSAYLNFEIAAVAVDDTKLAGSVAATIEQRRASFRAVTEADLPVRPWSRAIDALCGLLSPLL
jgi:cardiolipin synthase